MVTKVDAVAALRKKLKASDLKVGARFYLADLFDKDEWKQLSPTTFGRRIAEAWDDGLLPELTKHERDAENHVSYEVLSPP